MIRLRIAPLPYYKIRQKANETLKYYRLEETLPVPIEELLDLTLGINIITFPNLCRTHEINAFLANNFESIWVDEHLFLNLEKPYRFTLAHEFGHKVLHEDIFIDNKPNNMSDWQSFITKLSDADRQLLEYQADDFAGLFLVPEHHLEMQYNVAFNQEKRFLRNKFKVLPKYQFISIITKYIAHMLSPIFNVHDRVLEIRIRRSGLHKNISNIYPS